jgi:hypothetical protein
MKPKSISKQQTAGYNNFLLVIFDIKKEKTLKIFDDDGYKNFVLIGDFLIFDSGFGKDSNVIIYKLNPLEEVNTIKINGGCGLRNIPNG